MILKYRNVFLDCALVYCAFQILHFSQMEGLWQLCVGQVYWCTLQ